MARLDVLNGRNENEPVATVEGGYFGLDRYRLIFHTGRDVNEGDASANKRPLQKPGYDLYHHRRIWRLDRSSTTWTAWN